jgi:fumarate hydratase class II
MNVYKPLMIFNVTHSITVMTDGCVNFRKFLIGAPNEIRRRSRNTLNARSCW